MAIKTVTMSCPTEGARIYYTTDGSIPDQTKTLYTGAFQVDDAEVAAVHAVAYKEMMTWSNTAVAQINTITYPNPLISYQRRYENSKSYVEFRLVNSSSYPDGTKIHYEIKDKEVLISSGDYIKSTDNNIITEVVASVPGGVSGTFQAISESAYYVSSEIVSQSSIAPIVPNPILTRRFNTVTISNPTDFDIECSYRLGDDDLLWKKVSLPFTLTLGNNDRIDAQFMSVGTNNSYESEGTASYTMIIPSSPVVGSIVDTSSLNNGFGLSYMDANPDETMWVGYTGTIGGTGSVKAFLWSTDGTTWNEGSLDADSLSYMTNLGLSYRFQNGVVFWMPNSNKFGCVATIRWTETGAVHFTYMTFESLDGKTWSIVNNNLAQVDTNNTPGNYITRLGDNRVCIAVSYSESSSSTVISKLYLTQISSNGDIDLTLQPLERNNPNSGNRAYAVCRPYGTFSSMRSGKTLYSTRSEDLSGDWTTQSGSVSYGSYIFWNDAMKSKIFSGAYAVDNSTFRICYDELENGSVILSSSTQDISIDYTTSSVTNIFSCLSDEKTVVIPIPNTNILLYSVDGGDTWKNITDESSDNIKFATPSYGGCWRVHDKFFFSTGMAKYKMISFV